MLWFLVAGLWALLGTSLPMVSPVVESVVEPVVLDKGNNTAIGSSASSHLDKRVNGAGWPWDPPDMTGDNTDWVKVWDPSRYNCDSFASHFNRIPPMLKAGIPPGDTDNGFENPAFSNRIYDDSEIYIAFRQGALALMNILMDPNTADQHRVSFSGTTFPRPYASEYRATRRRVGLGSWQPSAAQQELPLSERTTIVHEWPLIEGGNYPYPGLGQEMMRFPGFERVLFQIVRGVPLYLGVISQRRGVNQGVKNQGGNQRDTWAYPVYEASGRRDQGLVESGVYPGLAADDEPGPTKAVLKNNRIRLPNSPVHPIAYTPRPATTPSPPPDPDGDGHAPAGGSSSRGGPFGPGGFSYSGGGSFGPQGGFEQYAAPMPGNVYKAGWNFFIPGPSHIEL